MSLIGERKMNLQAFLSGMHFLTSVLSRPLISPTQHGLSSFILQHAAHTKASSLLDHHKRLRAASDLAVSH